MLDIVQKYFRFLEMILDFFVIVFTFPHDFIGAIPSSPGKWKKQIRSVLSGARLRAELKIGSEQLLRENHILIWETLAWGEL